ncbi:uncharacterized protein Fot_31612 [Forsythia ovata]|uniref:Uncharacterized protein n=1 Tax=Forsythia ovata TaxID=205694 RepID=A0ABD1T5V1_9LAMI
MDVRWKGLWDEDFYNWRRNCSRSRGLRGVESLKIGGLGTNRIERRPNTGWSALLPTTVSGPCSTVGLEPDTVGDAKWGREASSTIPPRLILNLGTLEKWKPDMIGDSQKSGYDGRIVGKMRDTSSAWGRAARDCANAKAPPSTTFPRAKNKLKPISLPEDVYISKFFQKNLDSKHEDPIKNR